jgi:signal transduction histidine kinase
MTAAALPAPPVAAAYPAWAALVVAALAAVVLGGWALDIGILKSAVPGFVEMKVNTAVCFLLAALALALQRAPGAGPRALLAARLAASLVVLVGGLSLVEWVFALDLGIDQLLVGERSSAVMTSALGRMAPNTALNFLCDGCALLLIDWRTGSGRRPAQVLCLVELVMALLALIGYAYGVQHLYGQMGVTPMAIHTALAFLALSTGILWARPDSEAMALLTSREPSGRLTRRMLPAAILAPIILAGLCLQGVRDGSRDVGFAFAAMATACILIIAGLVWANARAIRRAEGERERQRAQASEHAASIADAYRRLRELETLRQDLVNMVVHDLRGPLSVVSLSSERMIGLLGYRTTPTLEELGNTITTQIDRMTRLITTLLDLSRLEAGEMPVERHPCALGEIIARVAARQAPGSSQVRITCPEVIVDCDRALIERVVLNLVSNAVTYSPRDAVVEVQVSTTPGSARIEVADRGPGIPDYLRPRLFTKFAAVGNAGQPSTGLGLAFCKLAVEAHGGSVGVESEPGHGSRFWFTLPLGLPQVA